MDASRIWLAVRLAALFYGAGLIVLWAFWPFLQAEIGPLFPSWVGPVTGQIAYWGIYATVGGMMLGVLPKFHRLRIVGDFIGCGAFLLNLMIQRNSGNVALEVALVLLTGWSLWANKAQHQPITASRSKLAGALFKLAVCYGVGWLLALQWPVTPETQWAGWYWQPMAVVGALIIFISLLCLEVRVICPTHMAYPIIYGTGCLLLTLSYLGEFNRAGLILNSSLMLLMWINLHSQHYRGRLPTFNIPKERPVEV